MESYYIATLVIGLALLVIVIVITALITYQVVAANWQHRYQLLIEDYDELAQVTAELRRGRATRHMSPVFYDQDEDS